MPTATDPPLLPDPSGADEALRVLVKAGRVLGVSLDYHATLNALVDLLVPGFADGCVVRLLDTDERLPQVHVSHSDPAVEQALRRYYEEFFQAGAEEPPHTARLVEQGEPLLIPEFDEATFDRIGATPAWRELVRGMGLQSLLAVPMTAAGRTIGVLSLGMITGARRYGQRDVPVVMEVAARAATAVDHARLHHAEREARATAEIAAEDMRQLHAYHDRLHSIIEGLDRQQSYEDAVRFVTETTSVAIGARHAWAGRISEDRRQLRLIFAHGLSGGVMSAYATLPIARATPAGRAIRDGQPLYIPDLRLQRREYEDLIGAADGDEPAALAVVPLLVEGRVIGAMGFGFDEARPFRPVEREFLQTVGRHAAVALTRLELEAELRATSDRLELERSWLMALVEQMPAGVVVAAAPSGRVVLNNTRATELLGHEVAEYAVDGIGERAPRHLDGTPFRPDEYPLNRALRGDTVEQELLVYERGDGRITQFLASAAPVHDAEGQIAYAVSTFHDVSERIRMEEELRRSRVRLDQALAAAHMGTWIWDLASGSVTFDDNLPAVFGLPHGHPVTPDDLVALVHPDDREYVYAITRRAGEQGTAVEYEFRAVAPDGTIRWIAVQGQVIRDEAGQPAYFAGVSVDVTDRKMAEVQLREAQKMEAVGRLAGGMAHEINNMMSVVLGFTEFLARDPGLSPTAREDAAEIRKAAERAAGITRQVLAFSRQQMMAVETLELNAVITGSEQLIRRVLGPQVEVVVSLEPSAGHVRADPNQLSQILVNLALNARDAMAGPGRLTIRTAARRLAESDLRGVIGIDVVPGEYVELAVADTGTGMDAETLARAFEPFFTTKPVGEGTGLGLSTVYGIVKQSHGYVWAESAAGRGTTVRLVFPRVQPGEPVPAMPGPAAAPGLAQTARILLVEDEAMVRAIARRSLEGVGYEVVEAEDGVGALGLLASGLRVDLVLTDIIMPRMTGRELARQVRERWPGLPILYMSGHPPEEMVRRGLLGQDEACVQKPFQPDHLTGEVARVLAQAPGARA